MEKQKISLNLPVDVLERIDELAKLADMDRTRLMTNILDECSKTLMATKKVGVFQFAVLMRNFQEKMTEWAKRVQAIKVDPL